VSTQPGKRSVFRRAGAVREAISPWIAAIAVIAFGTAGFARVTGWSAGPGEVSGETSALERTGPQPAESMARSRLLCAECGTIVSVREIEVPVDDSGSGAAGGATASNRDGDESRGKSVRRYEISLRMADGSSRVIDDAFPARWRPGERLVVIAGSDPLRR